MGGPGCFKKIETQFIYAFSKIVVKWFGIFKLTNSNGKFVPPSNRRHTQQIRINTGSNFLNESCYKSRVFLDVSKKPIDSFLRQYLKRSLV